MNTSNQQRGGLKVAIMILGGLILAAIFILVGFLFLRGQREAIDRAAEVPPPPGSAPAQSSMNPDATDANVPAEPAPTGPPEPLRIANHALANRSTALDDASLYRVEAGREFAASVAPGDRPRLVRLKSRAFLVTPFSASVATGLSGVRECYVSFVPETAGQARAEMEARGASTLDHVTGHTWRMDLPDVGLLAGVSGIIGIEPVLPEDKISPRVWQEMQGAVDGAIDTPVVVGFNDGTAFADAADVLARAGARTDDPGFAYNERLSATIPVNAVAVLAAQPAVHYVDGPPPPEKTFNLQAAMLANADDVRAPPYNLSGTNINVTVRDTVVFPHTEFGTRLTVVDGGAAARHGTHVSGTIAADGSVNNNATGMAPAANLFTYDFQTGTFVDDLTDSVDNNSSRLSNHSYGTIIGWDSTPTGWVFNANTALFGQYDSVAEDRDDLIEDRDLVVVKSAGNDRDDAGPGPQPPDGTPGPDGQYDCVGNAGVVKNVITVGAFNPATGPSTTAVFSSWGPADDGRIKPDLMAKGVGTFSLNTNDLYATLQGTSMASPTVCGAIALLFEQHKISNAGAEPAAALAKALVINAASDMSRDGPDYQTGWGQLDIQRAVDVVRNEAAAYNLIRESSVSQGTTNTSFLTVAHANNLKLTLAWTDPPGNPVAALALVNDLDLEAVSPSGVTHYPYIMPFAQLGGSLTNVAVQGVNTRDNIEKIEIECPEPGTWTFRVIGTSVPLLGPQDFALVAHADDLPDRLEPNESLPAAADIGVAPGVHLIGLAIHCDTDEDFYRFRIVRPDSVTVNLTGAPGHELDLFDADGAPLGTDTILVGGTNATVDLVGLTSGVYYAQVTGTAPLGTNGTYALDIEPHAASGTRVLYINHPSVANPAVNSFYTLAPGNDGNDGLTPFTPKATVSNLLTTYALGGSDLVLIDSADYTHDAAITAADGGAAYAGAPGISRFTLATPVFTLANSHGSCFYDLHFVGNGAAFDLANADSNLFERLTLANNDDGIYIVDDAGSASESNRVVECVFTNTGTAVHIENSTGTLVVSNRITRSGTYGVRMVAGSLNDVRHNLIDAKTYGVHVFDGDRHRVEGNRVGTNGSYGVYVDQAAQMVVRGNIFRDRTYGTYVKGVSGNEGEVLIEDNTCSNLSYGIYLSGNYTALSEVRSNRVIDCSTHGIHSATDGNIHDNEVWDCNVGIFYDGAAVGVFDNHIHHNTTGLAGDGLLGGASWAPGQVNDIHDNGTGVAADSGAEVQYNVIRENLVGIAAAAGVSIHHNLLYENSQQGILVDNDHTVPIVNNTVYTSTGDCVRVIGGSTGVTLFNNILWTEDGYCLYVATDSQVGFDSDYNNYFATGAGVLVWWQKEFIDLLDWQVEADLDNHSIGNTLVNPILDNPMFVNAAAGDFHLGAGSTSIDAGDFGSAFGDEPGPNGDRINLGAYGGTDMAAVSPPSFVTLLFPDYYTDWPVSEGRSILWTNFNLTGNADVDLYQEGVGKIADLTVAPMSAGSFAWTPADSAIAGHTTNRYRIRVTSTDLPALFDESREPFSIPLEGPDYYVNDGSTTDDQYTTAAGGNRQTGKTPGDPKANVIGVPRNYMLGPGDTVWVDHGSYLHVRNVTISADPGLGNDEGMVIAGPTLGMREAFIERGNSFTGATTFDVNGADFVAMRHLTLNGGNRGIWVRNGSGNFDGSHLLVKSNSVDGIRVEAGSTASSLQHLTVHDNGEDGISVATPIGTISNCVVYANGDYGIELSAAGDARVEACEVYGNDTGIYVANNAAGTRSTVGHADLAASLGNKVYDNLTEGIHVSSRVAVYGNTVYGQDGANDRGLQLRGSNVTAAWNVVYGNYDGIYAAGLEGDIEHNRVYHNARWGIYDYGQGGRVRRNTVYSNAGGIHGKGSSSYGYTGEFGYNLVYDNAVQAIRLEATGVTVVENNTVFAPTGNAIEIVGNTRDVVLRNNILSLDAGYGVQVDLTAQSGFDSDYNLFHLTGTGQAGFWQAAARASLVDWKTATFGDANSFVADPEFVDPEGPDTVLGYDTGGGVDAGEDDDFHLRSLYGRFHGGSQAPLLDGVSGLPVLATSTETNDTVQSPAIDRGDETYPYAAEPPPNGSFINLGTYGDSDQASKSPAEYVTILQPAGGESWPAEQSFLIRWRSHDTNDTVDIELYDGGISVLLIQGGTPNDGEFLWMVSTNEPPSTNYTIEITRNGVSTVGDTSEVFAVTGPINEYFVNDGTNNPAGDWTTAAGNDANDGLTPATPKASVRGVLQAYDLGPGDLVRVDDGDYPLSQTLLIAPDDSGVRIEGYNEVAFPARRALLDRGNTAEAAVEVDDADDVEIAHLHITGGQRGVYVFSDADNLRVEDCEIYGNDLHGIYVVAGCEFATLSGNTLYGFPGGSGTDNQDDGIEVRAHDARILGNTVYDSADAGIYLEAERGLIEGNLTYRNERGIWSNGTGSGDPALVLNNTSWSNSLAGIYASGRSRVEGNTCFGQTGLNDYGIWCSGQYILAVNNTCHENETGLYLRYGARAEENRVYNCSRWGIYLQNSGHGSRNHVYSNRGGISAQGGASYGFQGTIENNLVYDNVDQGIRIGHAGEGTVVRNNTVYEPGGNAAELVGDTRDVLLHNNILQVDTGFAVYVESTAQDGLDSDYNLFHLTGSGRLGWWDGTEFSDRADWFYDLGLDEHSRTADPLFVDREGADTILGYESGSDYGLDDDFHLQSASPGIDNGDLVSYHLEEPRPSGERVNQGAYGNCGDAAPSDDRIVQVLYPNGLEKFEVGESVHVTWRSAGLTPTGWVARINVGGVTEERWLYGRYRTEGTSQSSFSTAVDRDGVTNPAPEIVYQKYAYAVSGVGNRTAWMLPVPDGTYQLRLHFVEPTYNSLGSRQFDIVLQGVVATAGYDIRATAGARYKAVAESYVVTAAGGDGIEIALVNQTSNAAILSGIELLAANPMGSASPTVDLEYSNDNGGFWSGIATGEVIDTEGEGSFVWLAGPATTGNSGLIRVQVPGSLPLVEDASDNGFLVSPVGTEYYVNDQSFAGDILTTALGDNLNSGRFPGQPMASLNALLAAYDLDPGDTVFVDTGSYTALVNLVIGATDAGVRFEGPPVGAAIVDRANVAAASSVFELIGAADVEFANLHITGGYRGIQATADSDGLLVEDCMVYANQEYGVSTDSECDFAVLTGNTLYGIPGGSSDDNQAYGLYLEGDDARALGNVVFDCSTDGIYQAAERGLLEGNMCYRNTSYGIYANGHGSDLTVVFNNTCWSNTTGGIEATGRTRAEQNTTYGHTGSSDIGILGNGANVSLLNNVSYDNSRGLYVQSDARAEGNRVYNNSDWGIYVYSGGDLLRNHVYSNQKGVYLYGSTSYGFDGAVDNNRIYANSGVGLRVYRAGDETYMRNNTVYETVGNAVELVGNTRDVLMRNNILCADSGYALYVESTAQDGFDCDYNLYHLTGSGVLAWWGGVEFAAWLDWTLELGFDRQGWTSDPLFVDPAGPDTVLGYDTGGDIDRGLDDNFRLQGASPGVDRGNLVAYHLEEPLPSGDRVNLGAYGNTPEAAVSPSTLVQVLAPNGYEKFEEGELIELSWRSAGLTLERPVARINAGGPTVEDWLYNRYQTEVYSESSFSSSVDLGMVTNPAPEDVYQRYELARSGVGNQIAWALPVPDDHYALRLHFAESSSIGVGSRVFDILLQGAAAATNVDVRALAGARYKALALSFPVTAAGGTGITIELRNLTSNGAILNAIELTAMNPGGFTAPLADAEVSPHGAGWTPVAAAVPFDAEGRGATTWIASAATTGNTAHVRVTAAVPAPPDTDVSDRPFLVGPAGNEFYINDTNTGADIYTNVEGDDAHDGRTPDTPMANLGALLDAYDLDPGDTVYVDVGDYRVLKDAVVDPADGGVTVQGPTNGVALLDRTNTAVTADCIEVDAASNVRIDRLRLTGGYRGVNIINQSTNVTVSRCVIFANDVYGVQIEYGSPGARIESNTLYGIPGGSSTDNQDNGIEVRGHDAHVANNLVYDSAYEGIDFNGERGVIESNTVYRCSDGLYVVGSGSETTIVRQNISYDNTGRGIWSGSRCLVVDNVTYGQNGSSDAGIYASGGNVIVRANRTFDNAYGIYLYSGAVAEGNRAFFNSEWGIYCYSAGTVSGNKVYSNGGGIMGYGTSDYGFDERFDNNVVYANANKGIRLHRAGTGMEVVNNTVYALVGNAIELTDDTRDVVLRNNILWVDAGFDIYVESTAESGLDSDYNVFHLGVDPNARIGFFGGANRDDLTAWQAATLGDVNSLFADPLFVDRDGADDILGYLSGGGSDYDGGVDDNFHLASFSPAIDRADEPPAPLLDAESAGRADDPGSLNLGTGSGIVEIGAYEFLGSSLDTNPPVVTATAPVEIDAETTVDVSIVAFSVHFNEAIDSIDAVSPANFILVHDSDTSGGFDPTDTFYDLTPLYAVGTTQVALFADALLPDGLYRLTIQGAGVHDLAGNELDGDNDTVAGGDYVRIFTIVDSGIAEGFDSVLRVPAGIEIMYPVLPGYDYWVEFRDDMMAPPDWVPLSGGPHNLGTVLDSPPPGIPYRYYRIRRVAP